MARILRLSKSSRDRLLAYGTALVALTTGLLLRWYLQPALGDRGLYSTFLPAVILASYFGGFWPGFLITLLAAATNNFLLVEPNFRLELNSAQVAELRLRIGKFAQSAQLKFHPTQNFAMPAVQR